MCEPQTFLDIDQATHDRLLAFANSEGVQFDGDKASYKGLDFTWNYDAASSALTVQCVKKPFVVSCGTVFSHIDDLIQKGKGDTL